MGTCAGSLLLTACGGGSDAPTGPAGQSRFAQSMALGDLLCLPLGFQPDGTLECNGQSVYRVQYRRLFERIGTTFGSRDDDTFMMPTIPPLRPASGPPAACYIVAEPPDPSTAVEGLVGEVRLFATEPDPAGDVAADWLVCDGRSLPIADHVQLFSLTANDFGGDGISDFRLPDLEPVPAGGPAPLRYRIARAGSYPKLGGDAATPRYEDTVVYGLYLPAIVKVAYGRAAARLEGFALCAGQMLEAKREWYPLEALLGNRYGGDDAHTFQLPTVPDSGGLVHVLLYNGIFPPRP